MSRYQRKYQRQLVFAAVTIGFMVSSLPVVAGGKNWSTRIGRTMQIGRNRPSVLLPQRGVRARRIRRPERKLSIRIAPLESHRKQQQRKRRVVEGFFGQKSRHGALGRMKLAKPIPPSSNGKPDVPTVMSPEPTVMGLDQKPGGKLAEKWRYRRHNGRWWYWMPSKRWAVWDDNRWIDSKKRKSVVPTGGHS